MEVLQKFLTVENIQYLLQGAVMSIIVAVASLFFGTIFGILGAAARMSRRKLLRTVGNVYVQVIRGTPMMLQILFFYLGGPVIWKFIFGRVFTPNPFIVGIIAVSINSGAYSTELIRSAIQSIDRGQWEASMALGLTHKQMMRLVILPQSFKRILPPFISEFITLIKDSSLLSSIGAVELLTAAKILGANYYNYIVPLCMASAIYLVMTMTISHFAAKVERRLAESD